MNNSRIHSRKDLDISNFPVKVKFLVGDKVYFTGKVYDISRNGLCIMTNVIDIDDENLQTGNLHIYKLETVLEVPVILKWSKTGYTSKFYGFQTELDLYRTQLKSYLD